MCANCTVMMTDFSNISEFCRPVGAVCAYSFDTECYNNEASPKFRKRINICLKIEFNTLHAVDILQRFCTCVWW